MSELEKSKFEQKPMPWQAARAVAIAAGLFTLILCVLLIADFIRIQELGESKIENLEPAFDGDHQISWLEIPVHDPLFHGLKPSLVPIVRRSVRSLSH